MPWHATYLDVLSSRVSDSLKVIHRKAVSRREARELQATNKPKGDQK